jgi:hypothetical protein
MFEGLAILPIQYHSTAQPTPFQRLAQAMLEDLFTAKEFAEKYPRVRWWQRQREADEDWLAGEPALLSFEAVCDLLGLSPDLIRQAYSQNRQR